MAHKRPPLKGPAHKGPPCGGGACGGGRVEDWFQKTCWMYLDRSLEGGGRVEDWFQKKSWMYLDRSLGPPPRGSLAHNPSGDPEGGGACGPQGGEN